MPRPARKIGRPFLRKVTETTRRCRTCKVEKKNTEFYGFTRKDRESRTDKRYYFSDCKLCHLERCRKDRYGVTLAEMIAKQGTALCPLCKERMAQCVDHDHETGRPRGAICRKCNLIMHYMDDREWVKRAEDYRAREV